MLKCNMKNNQRTATRMLLILSLLLCLSTVNANYPLFDETTKMRVLLVPTDTRVGSAIYRLRATDSDFDYPLAFEVLGRLGKNLLRVETLPCARNHTACEANVYLARALERGRFYQFRLSVRDSRGDATNVEASLRATNGSSVTAIDTAFPRYTTLVMVPENAKIGAELEYIMVRKNNQHSRHAYMELLGSPLFSMKQRLSGPDTSNGTIILKGELDFEKQNLYSMQLHATDPFVNFGWDSRNILGFDLAIVVTDVQDTPPVFIMAPPVTPLSAQVQPGDMVLQVKAEDGDRGHPRDIRYGLLSEGNPFTPFFSIDENTGEVHLTRTLNELRAISRPGQPVMLRVLAEEVTTDVSSNSNDEETSQSSIAELALLLPGSANTAPYFESESYVANIAEGSAPGTPLLFTDPWMPRVRDNDMGLGAVFSLSLQDDNGTFEISPTVAEGSANFVVRVKNNAMLDYERFHSLGFKVVAREVSQSSSLALSGTATVTVILNDVNDNAPHFQQSLYTASLPENITAGTLVAQVHADDMDTGTFGRVRYTRLLGQMNGSLAIDPETGQIIVATNSHGFDREEAPEYRLYVEARDEEGEGQAATVPLVITLIDVNDHAPVFEYDDYELFLGPENKNFTTRVFLKAIDADAETPNNEIRYEIMSGNVGDKFQLDEIMGELTVRPIKEKRIYKRELAQNNKEPSLYVLNVRAYDLGVPHRWSRATVRIHSAGSDGPTKGSVVFIVPRSPASVLADPRRTERLLAQLTGGRVAIREVRPYRPGDPELIAADLAPGIGDSDKSVVVALVTYTGEPAVVDVAQMQQRLMANQTTNTITREVVTEYRAESSAIFWFTLFLALLLAIAILILIICFFCTGCPLYISRKPRSAEEVRLVLERGHPRDDEDKILVRREAWSAEGGRRYFQFNRRNILTLDHRPIEEGRGAAGGIAGGVAPGDTQTMQAQSHHSNVPPGPSIIYTSDFQRHRKRDVFVEDVENEYPSARKVNFNPRESTRSLPSVLQTPSNILTAKDRDVHSIIVHQEESADEIDSMRRHEMERGSDLGQVRYIMRERSAQTTQEPEIVEVLTLDEEEANGREQHYLKAGNAEVLRLVTRGKPDENGYRQSRTRRVNQTDAGKDIIMRRFMEDQRQLNNMSVGGNSSQMSLPGQVLLQTGTQTDEERGTQTENDNDSLNSPNNTPPHSKHIIKTPILEETESSLEHINTANRMARENSNDGEVHKFQKVVEEAYERGKAETEFNYGDTKSTTLRRKMNYEKAGIEETTPDDSRKQVDRDSHAYRERESKQKKGHRSQSVPRNVSENKRKSSVNEVQNRPLRHKSSSINSGLDKSSRVHFASPDQSLSDDEVFVALSNKKSVSGTSSLRASNTSLNKSVTSKRISNKIDSFSDEENLSPNKNKKITQSKSNFRGSNLSLNSTKKYTHNKKESFSDEENELVNSKSKKSSSLHASRSSLKSTSPALKNRKTHVVLSDDDMNDKKERKVTSSLRVGKSSIKKSPSPKIRKTRRGSVSDDENEKPVRVTKSRNSSVTSVSVSPAPKSRKTRNDVDSDEDMNANKQLKANKTVRNIKTIERGTKKPETSSLMGRSKNREDNGSEEEIPKTHLSKSRSSNSKIEKNKQKTTEKSTRIKQNKAETENNDKVSSNLRKSTLHSSKNSLNKSKTNLNKADDNAKDNEQYSDENSETENSKGFTNPSIPKSNFTTPDTKPINMDDESDEISTIKKLNDSVENSLHNSKETEPKQTKSQSTCMDYEPTNFNIGIENELKNNITSLEESINNKLNERLAAIECKLDSAIDSRSNNNNIQNTNNSMLSENETNLSNLNYGILPLVHTSPDNRNNSSGGDGRISDILQQETAMQTDVTLVPLINSIGLGRGGRDDDLDSGIAMSLTASDVRSRRLNQLIEKKSIFTIAYDDMHTKQLRADSASPQY